MPNVRSGNNSQIALAKMVVPPFPLGHCTRHQANRLLRRALRSKVAVLVSPVGGGKTTLMCEWYAILGGEGEPKSSTAWLSLDSRDVNPVRLWSHFIEAVSRAYQSEFAEAGDYFENGSDNLEVALSNHMFNAAKNTNLQVIFIDNLEAVSEELQTELLQFAYNYLPDTSCLVVACTDIPKVLNDFRYSSGISIFNANDLLLAPDEVAEMVTLYLGRELPIDFLDAVSDYTLGWPIALQLACATLAQCGAGEERAALSNMSKSARVHSFFRSFMDQEELADLRDFMVDTSLCDSVCEGLCWAITKRADAAELIDRLLDCALLFPAHNKRSGWYRYHPMLLDWLRAQLVRKGERHMLDLADRASEWFKGKGAAGDLAKLALVGSDADFVESLVSLFNFDCPYPEGGYLAWVCSIDSTHMAEQFMPSLYAMRAYYLADDAENLNVWLKNFRHAVTRELESVAGVEHHQAAKQIAELARIKSNQLVGDYDGTVKELHRFFYTWIDMEPSVSCLAFHALGEAYERAGDFEGAYANYLRAEVFADTVDSEFYKAFSRYSLAWVQTMSGDMRQARSTVVKALGSCPRTLTLHGALLGLQAYIQIESFELASAAHSLNEAKDELSSVRNADMWLEFHVIRARLLSAQGDYDAAYGCLLSAMAQFEHFNASRGVMIFAGNELTRINIFRNDLEDAKRVIADINPLLGDADEFYELKIKLNRLIINVREAGVTTATAIERINELSAQAKEHGFGYVYLDMLIWKALLCDKADDRSACFNALYEALRLAAPENAINPFALRETRIPALLHEIADVRKVGSVERAFARTVLSVVFSESVSPAGAKQDIVSLARLTVREREILKLLNAGMSRQEIALEQGVSINTVKTHISNLYSKLGVTSRSEAFAITHNSTL